MTCDDLGKLNNICSSNFAQKQKGEREEIMADSSGGNGTSSEIEKGIFLPAIITVFAVVLLMVIFEASAKTAMSAIFNFCTDQLGSIYMWFGVFALGVVVWLGFGRYGHVRLGGPDAQPEFGRFSWIANFARSCIYSCP